MKVAHGFLEGVYSNACCLLDKGVFDIIKCMLMDSYDYLPVSTNLDTSELEKTSSLYC